MIQTPLWHPSVLPSARHWPAREELQLSLSKSAAVLHSPWTPRIVKRFLLLKPGRSPLSQKRNDRRRKEFLASKEASFPVEKTLNVESTHLASVLELQETTSGEDVNAKVSCDICGHETKTANGIKLYKQKKHQVDQIDGNSSLADIQEYISEEKITQTEIN